MRRPPRAPGLLVRLLLPGRRGERIRADLDEEWCDFVRPSRSGVSAWLWYCHMAARSVISSWVGAIRDRPSPRLPGHGAGGPGSVARVDGVLRDLRFGVRSLLRDPGTSVPAVLVTALGIAAAAIVFTVLDRALLRPLPFDDPDRVVALHGARLDDPGGSGNVSYPNSMDVGDRTRTLSGVAAASWWGPAFTEEGRAQVVRGLTVSWNYFDVLGVDPAAGRFFVAEEEGAGRPAVAVLSHGLWLERYGGDPATVGRTVSVNNMPYLVVGIAPEGFEDPLGAGEGLDVRIWRTPWFDAAEWYRSGRSWKGLARLGPESSLTQANEELGRIFADLAAEWPEENRARTMFATPVSDWVVGPARTTILVLAGAVGLVLLISCANIANLLLARGMRRAQELSVRVAIGASGGQLFRATLVESVVLASVGGALGVGLAFLGLEGVISLASSWIPRLEGAAVDLRVLAFSAAAAVSTGLVFGVLPGLRSRRMAQWSRTSTPERAESRLRRTLVVVEVASTVVLLFGAGLFVRTFEALYRVDVGIDTERLVTVGLHDSGWLGLEPEAASAQWDRVLDGVRALPEVAAAGAIDIVPLADNYSCDGTNRLDLPPPAPGEGQCTEVRTILPGAFEALGITVVAGRPPASSDRDDAPRVVWISEATWRMFWPEGGDAVGSGLKIHAEDFTVAGVVSDVRHFGPQEPPRPMVYLPAHHEPWNGITRGLTLVVQSRGADVGGLGARVREAVEVVGPTIPVAAVQTGPELLAGRTTAPMFRLALAGGFAGVALLIAMVGLAGVLSFSVSRRRREIGVRLALGAESGQIRGMVMGEGLGLLWRGLVLGMMVAVPTGVALSRFLFGVRPWDPLSIVAVTVLMVVGVVAACYPPALRAARGSPMAALRID